MLYNSMVGDYSGFEITEANPEFVWVTDGRTTVRLEVIPFDDRGGSGFVNVYDSVVGNEIISMNDYQIVVETPSGSHTIESTAGSIGVTVVD